MMEQYSYYPAPEPGVASLEISGYIKWNSMLIPQYSELVKKTKEEVFTETAFKYYSQNTPEWSMAAWYSGGMKEYAEETIRIFVRKKNRLMKLRGILKSCVFLYLCYKDAIERRYKPGGVFEKEASLIWNPILQANDI